MEIKDHKAVTHTINDIKEEREGWGQKPHTRNSPISTKGDVRVEQNNVK